MRRVLHFLFPNSNSNESVIRQINRRREDLGNLTDDALCTAPRKTLIETVAVTAVVIARILGLVLFDVQMQGALALANGKIAEMKTGEGKTAAAVPAVVWYAQQGHGVHVMTANDYLARRDAEWMRGIYEFLGFKVGYIQQGMKPEERRRMYACDIVYATANEIGFDYLRDQLAMYPQDQVHRPFAVAVVDEADSILIDEARIPLVIAGGRDGDQSLAYRVDAAVRRLHPGLHFTTDENGRNIALTDAGIAEAERSLVCGNLFADDNLPLFTAVQDSLHAHALLRRDVDYLVKNGAIESIDELKGRIALDRRWPAGLHTAIEAKEGVLPKEQGRILGSITVQNLIALYPKVCGMTGTAETQAEEFQTIYKLGVEIIPTNRPVIRVDHPDVVCKTRAEKDHALLEEIRTVHATGQPILVGTASVEESERLSRRLRQDGIAHQVLNARNDEQEATIIAQAGRRGVVTISTNMAGRGTDIALGEGVSDLGGLHVIGTNRHDSRRIDNQLRGRAGRQGDPGSSRFFVSFEDPLVSKYGKDESTPDLEHLQKVAEGQQLEIRRFLHKYETYIEGHRQSIHRERQDILTGVTPVESETARFVSLATLDDLWAEYLAALGDLRAGIHWISLGGGDPFLSYVASVHELFDELQEALPEETERRIKEAQTSGFDPAQRGATWTYLTTDQPFGTLSERVIRGLVRKFRGY
jgi:preprotein translocase subunit SecA